VIINPFHAIHKIHILLTIDSVWICLVFEKIKKRCITQIPTAKVHYSEVFNRSCHGNPTWCELHRYKQHKHHLIFKFCIGDISLKNVNFLIWNLCSSNDHFNLTFLFMPMSTKWSFPLQFSEQNFVFISHFLHVRNMYLPKYDYYFWQCPFLQVFSQTMFWKIDLLLSLDTGEKGSYSVRLLFPGDMMK
jgi:hypothetical protein